jgi:hypothetical protein
MRKILWLILVFTIAAYICGPIVDPDLWWHITVGRWIVSNVTVPTTDHWTMFSYGQPWRAYSWSFEVVVALLDRYFGAHGLFYFKLFLAIVFCFSLSFICSKLTNDWFFGLLIGLFGALATYNHFTLRPQLLVWVIFAYLLYVCEKIRNQGFTTKEGIKIFLLMCLWANLHITTAIGLAALVFWLWQPGQQKSLLMALGVGFLGTLLTPYLGGEWLTFFSKTSHPLDFSMIAEFQAATIMQYSTSFFIILAFLLVIFFVYAPKLIVPSQLLLCAGLSFAGLAFVKFLPFAEITCVLVLASTWGKANADNKKFGNIGESISRLYTVIDKIPREGLSFVFICWSIVLLRSTWLTPMSEEVIPVQAFNYFQEKNLPVPVLIGFGQGGYQMYRFSDLTGELPSEKHRVSIDGRTNLISADLWQKHKSSLQGNLNWKDYITLVKPETIIWKNESPFVSLLEASKEWCLLFRSGNNESGYSVYVKQGYYVENRAAFGDVICH